MPILKGSAPAVAREGAHSSQDTDRGRAPTIRPPEAIPLLSALGPAFTLPTHRRFVTLLLAAALATGRPTVATAAKSL
jgi:hypothetical protein